MSSNLKSFMERNNDTNKSSEYYGESFCNIVFDYLGSYGGFSKEDLFFLRENGYSEGEFLD